MSLLSPRGDGTPLVKLCGLRRVQDVDAALAAGADMLGIVFAPSRRRMTPEAARTLVRHIGGRAPVIGVFVHENPGVVREAAAVSGIDAIQLSGGDDEVDYAALGLPVIKVMHTGSRVGQPDWLHIKTSYPTAGLIVDSWSPQGGGSGIVADWAAVRELVSMATLPTLLAGGLNADNVVEALRATGAAGADVSSGVELDGWKDPALMRRFVEAVRGVDSTSALLPEAPAMVNRRDDR